MQHADTPVLDDGIAGLLEGLAARGFRDGDTIALERFNAQGDMATGAAIAKQVTSSGVDLVITASTPSMQAVASSNREGRTRHVFFLVADPFASGIGLDRSDPAAHPAHLAGHGIMIPVENSFVLARQLLPTLQRIGVAWNPAESNSVAFTEKAREAASRLGLTLLEANVDNTSAVTDAVNSLIARGAQALWVGGDNTMIAAMDSVIAMARRGGIPVFSVLPGRPDRGTLFDIGPDFVEAGRQAATLVADVLEGADMAAIPIRNVSDIVPPFLSVNANAVKGLAERWQIPEEVRRRATVLVDERGVHDTRPRARSAAGGGAPVSKKWRLSFVQLNRVLDVEEAEAGVMDGLKEAGLVAGRDYEVSVRNAQGDMATVSGLVDAALVSGTDLLVTFSTPTLQAAIARASGVPIVFTYVASAFAAGAGKSDTDHLPNLTGVYMVAAYDQMLALIRECLPAARTLGTVYVPAEVNSVHQRDALVAAADKAGVRVKAVAANSTSEVADAALALSTGGIDAICQIPGNLTAAAYPSIAQAARQARIPVFVFQSSQARAGAIAAIARDYHDAGRKTAQLIARVMRGEPPAAIPLVAFEETRRLVNLDAARQLGFRVPQAVIDRADEVIGPQPAGGTR